MQERFLKIAQHLENVKTLPALTDREVARAIRDAVIAEEGAINQYETVVDSTENEKVKEVLQEIADEEKVHVGELQTLLSMLLEDEDELLEEGASEVEASSRVAVSARVPQEYKSEIDRLAKELVDRMAKNAWDEVGELANDYASRRDSGNVPADDLAQAYWGTAMKALSKKIMDLSSVRVPSSRTAADRTAKEKRIEILRRIVKDHQNEKIDGVRIDLTTAGMLVTVYEALEKKGSDMSKFDRIPLMKLVDFGWKSVTASDYSGLRSRRAMYWGGPGMTYRLTKEEQQTGTTTCPRCKGPMEKEPFMRGEKLYLCPECRFKVPTSKTTTTRIQIDVAPDGEVDVDVTTAGKNGSKIGRRTR